MNLELKSCKRLPALDGVTVVQWGESVACGYAAKMLADFGARVIRLNARTGDPETTIRSHMNARKHSIDCDPFEAAGRTDFDAVLQEADLLLEDHAPASLLQSGLDPDQLRLRHPHLIVVSITPFGQSGPYRDWKATDRELSFLAGLAHLTPRDIAQVGDGADQPPLGMPGRLVSVYGGISAAGAALAALNGRGRTREGSHVDVALLESLIPTLRREIALERYEGVTASRFMRVWKLAPWGVKRCADGFVFVQVVEVHHWEELVKMMGSPEWACDPRYLNPDFRFAHRVEMESRIDPWLRTQSKADFAWEAQRRSLPFAPVNSVADVLAIPQLHSRQFFDVETAGNGRPCIVPTDPFRFTRGAPGDGPITGVPRGNAVSDRVPEAPLAGIRVVDFGHVWAGPYCAATLADMGAEVIKIESPQRMDIHRRQGPYPDMIPGPNRSGVWNAQNRGKKSISLNLTTDEGRDLALKLVATADIVIENFAPGVMAKLGLDFAQLSAVRPNIVMLSLSAFGQQGPQKRVVGYGPSLDAWSGLTANTCYADGEPKAMGGIFPDTGSALAGIAAVLAALHHRSRTGEGRYIDVSELELSILLLSDMVIDAINGIGSDAPQLALPQISVRANDGWLSITAGTREERAALCKLLGLDNDPGDEAVLRALSVWTSDRKAGDAMRTLQAMGIAAGVAHDAIGLQADAQLVARGFFQRVRHPEVGEQLMYGPIWRLNGRTATLTSAPLLGEHTDEVVRALTGLPEKAVSVGVIA